MARTVADALKVRNQLEGLRTTLVGLDWPTQDLVDAVTAKMDQVEHAAGDVVFPPGAAQSRVIDYDRQDYRFNPGTGHFEMIVAEDPANIYLAAPSNGNGGGTNGGGTSPVDSGPVVPDLS